MIHPIPVTLEAAGIRLEPMGPQHAEGIAAAVQDGRLWELWFTTVPEPAAVAAYVETALAGQRDGHMLPWVVRDTASGALIGSTRVWWVDGGTTGAGTREKTSPIVRGVRFVAVTVHGLAYRTSDPVPWTRRAQREGGRATANKPVSAARLPRES